MIWQSVSLSCGTMCKTCRSMCHNKRRVARRSGVPFGTPCIHMDFCLPTWLGGLMYSRHELLIRKHQINHLRAEGSRG